MPQNTGRLRGVKRKLAGLQSQAPQSKVPHHKVPRGCRLKTTQVAVNKKGRPVKATKQQLEVDTPPVVTQPSRTPQGTVTIKTKKGQPSKVIMQQLQEVRQPVVTQPSRTALLIINTWLVALIKMRDGREASHRAVLQYCRQQFWWKTAIGLADSVERYEAALRLTLEDGKLSKGQQQVLEIFTRDVCALHLPIATGIWTLYTKNIQ